MYDALTFLKERGLISEKGTDLMLNNPHTGVKTSLIALLETWTTLLVFSLENTKGKGYWFSFSYSDETGDYQDDSFCMDIHPIEVIMNLNNVYPNKEHRLTNYGELPISDYIKYTALYRAFRGPLLTDTLPKVTVNPSPEEA